MQIKKNLKKNMLNYPNRLFSGWCSNEGNKKSNVLRYDIYTVRDITDYNGGSLSEEVTTLEEYFNLDSLSTGDPYYAVYLTFKSNVPRGPIKAFETAELKVAIYIVQQLSGNAVIENVPS